jgi:hypothetical protein
MDSEKDLKRIHDELLGWLKDNSIILEAADKFLGKDSPVTRAIHSSHRQIENITWHIENNMLPRGKKK